MGRISNSWSIAKSSWAVLKDEKGLVLIPVINLVAQVFLFAIVAGLVWLLAVDTGATTATTSGSESSVNTPVAAVIGIVGTYLAYFLTTYFLAVIVAGAHERLSGGDPTIGSMFATANRRLPQILGWSALSATVGLILQAIQERAGFLGAIVVNLVGLAWQLVTWLAVPAVVVEGTGPIASLKRSAGLFKTTWGENVVGQFGLGFVGLVAMLPGLAIGAGLVALGPTVNVVLGIAIGVVWVFSVAMVMTALNGIFRTALYIYATTGQVPDAYEAEQVTGAFRPKRGMFG